eukprot:TRINITY_DN11248_c0_g1_i2.p1 TRINITY_DN11248_c0_g1~~TRINITY_DN11248_c0_g1_i2.p1  ORF type:complete len:574 (+),score=134.43 TRINITY_DN11248_c0_g1_i2:46-1767(+)
MAAGRSKPHARSPDDADKAQFYYIGDEKDAFAKKMARMDEQLRRLREHEWRPVQLRDGSAGLSATHPLTPRRGEGGADVRVSLGRQMRTPITRPGRYPQRASTPPPESSHHESSPPSARSCATPQGRFLWLSRQSLSPSGRTGSSSSRMSPPEGKGAAGPSDARSKSRERLAYAPSAGEVEGNEAYRLGSLRNRKLLAEMDSEDSLLDEGTREQELVAELRESRQALEKMASLLRERDAQLHHLSCRAAELEEGKLEATVARASKTFMPASRSTSPDGARRRHAEQAVRDRARAEVLRAELAERDLEVQMLREAEASVEQRAAEELRAARVELAETRRQQEVLGLEIQEAELHQRRQWAASQNGERPPLLQLLGLPPGAPPEAKRERLREAVLALKEVVHELSESSRPAEPGSQSVDAELPGNTAGRMASPVSAAGSMACQGGMTDGMAVLATFEDSPCRLGLMPSIPEEELAESRSVSPESPCQGEGLPFASTSFVSWDSFPTTAQSATPMPHTINGAEKQPPGEDEASQKRARIASPLPRSSTAEVPARSAPAGAMAFAAQAAMAARRRKR